MSHYILKGNAVELPEMIVLGEEGIHISLPRGTGQPKEWKRKAGRN